MAQLREAKCLVQDQMPDFMKATKDRAAEFLQ